MDKDLQDKLNDQELESLSEVKVIESKLNNINIENYLGALSLRELFIIYVEYYGAVACCYNIIKGRNKTKKEILKDEEKLIEEAKKHIVLVRKKIIEKVSANYNNLGRGCIPDVPGINFTGTAQKGVYVTYLLNGKKKELFLTLNQGVSEGEGESKRKSKSKRKSIAQLKADAEVVRRKINYEHESELWPGNDQDQIFTGEEKYNAGCIYFKKYTLDELKNMKNDDELENDLKKFQKLDECYKNFVASNNQNYSSSGEGEENMSASNDVEEEVKDIQGKINKISSFIKAKGFKYADEQIKNFYLSLKTKPFVLLAGTSGTGKTRLVRLFAEAIGAFKPNEPESEQRYLQVPVKPDWTDSTDLFGHLDLNNNFVPGAIIDFIERASKEENRCKPYILCMDEMNLARVEYYLSDFLSVIETRDWDKDGKKIITDPLVPKACYSGAKEKTIEDRYKALQLPDNLYLVGTVNMDETTFPFSKKVLDRANTIEFSAVDLELHGFEGQEGQDQDPEGYIIEADNDFFLRAEYLVLQRDCQEGWNEVCEYNKKIKEINEILGDENFGYRIRDEIIFYMLYNNRFKLMDKKDDNKNDDKAFDYQIMQKILPRIQGESRTIETILKKLFIYSCDGKLPDGELDVNSMYDAKKNNYKEVVKKAKEETKTSKSYEEALREAGIKYSLSAAKIDKMLRRYEEDGFTTFWS